MKRKVFSLALISLVLLSLACTLPPLFVDREQTSAPPSPEAVEEADREEEAGLEPTASLSPSQTPGMVDCSDDLECFLTAVETCQQADLHYKTSLDWMGMMVTTTTQLTLQGRVEDMCVFRAFTEDVQASYTEEARQQMLESGQSEEQLEAQLKSVQEQQLAAGFDDTCRGKPADLIAMLEKWEAGSFSTEDWDPFTCQGKVFTGPPPVSPTPADEESQPAEDENFLDNLSFEIDPRTTDPRWVVEPRNTDLWMEWTTSQSHSGEYGVKLEATTTGNQGWPGIFYSLPAPLDQGHHYLFSVFAYTPDDGDASISLELLDADGNLVLGKGGGCRDLPSGEWFQLWIEVSPEELQGVTSGKLGLRQCLSNTQGSSTRVYYDDVFFGYDDRYEEN